MTGVLVDFANLVARSSAQPERARIGHPTGTVAAADAIFGVEAEFKWTTSPHHRCKPEHLLRFHMHWRAWG